MGERGSGLLRSVKESLVEQLVRPLSGSRRSDGKMGDSSSSTGSLLTEFCIPEYILAPNSDREKCSASPEYPVLVFINSKSGGQLGGDLLRTYRQLLRECQVFDVGQEAPDKVLHRVYGNLEKLKLEKDDLAGEIESKLRLIVAGGDGTAGWLLGVVCDLKLPHPPPIATVPLGTGNNLPFSFGWGKQNPGTDRQSVKNFLAKVKEAREMKIDSWHLLMRMRAPKEGACEPVAPLELPHSLHAFHRVSSDHSLNVEGHHTYRGGFWNYFSMGMDAQVSYEFHSQRKLHPERFKNQLVNQATYAKLGCTQGWFCASLMQKSDRNIHNLCKVKILKSGEWTDLSIPQSIRSIICLNLPSFSGGLNPWGMPRKNMRTDPEWTAPYVDDQLLEIVGFKDAWQGLLLMSSKGHGTRLAQTKGIRFEFHKGAADSTYMRIDGEPWKQPLPKDDDTVVVEITHLGQVNMLATHDCRSKSKNDSQGKHEEEDSDSGKEEFENQISEEQRKFGSAETFKLPDYIDMSRLS